MSCCRSAGVHVDTFAANLKGPRKMLLAGNGDILVSESSGGRISVMHPSSDGTGAAGADVFCRD